MLYPLTFQPIFKERIWGGRNLESLYQKKLPPHIPIGESWEISDRPSDESIIAHGPFIGKSLRWLMDNHRASLLGSVQPSASGRFPLLIKILDAQQKLSLQVHPPAAQALRLGGEPKTEMWYVAHATSEADLFAGLKPGTTRAEFERRIKDATVEKCFHRIAVKKGDALFLPSGRVHAIGAGNVIFEIQQNSDTTYRVFDWNRRDAHGQPRELHIEKSLESIDFNDIEPSLVFQKKIAPDAQQVLANDPLFSVTLCQIASASNLLLADRSMQILGVIEGKLTIHHLEKEITLGAGQFSLIPASLEKVRLTAKTTALFLCIQAG
ncbi:MAG: type I phosphomannose isomerase catalytic subunit [Verrucomicrobiota bacterium]